MVVKRNPMPPRAVAPTVSKLAGRRASKFSTRSISCGSAWRRRRARRPTTSSTPRLLMPYPENLAYKVQAKLQQMGVEVHFGYPVEMVDAEGVVINGEDVTAASAARLEELDRDIFRGLNPSGDIRRPRLFGGQVVQSATGVGFDVAERFVLLRQVVEHPRQYRMFLDISEVPGVVDVLIGQHGHEVA